MNSFLTICFLAFVASTSANSMFANGFNSASLGLTDVLKYPYVVSFVTLQSNLVPGQNLGPDQPEVVVNRQCTGFIVSDDCIVTSATCMRSINPTLTTFIIGGLSSFSLLDQQIFASDLVAFPSYELDLEDIDYHPELDLAVAHTIEHIHFTDNFRHFNMETFHAFSEAANEALGANEFLTALSYNQFEQTIALQNTKVEILSNSTNEIHTRVVMPTQQSEIKEGGRVLSCSLAGMGGTIIFRSIFLEVEFDHGHGHKIIPHHEHMDGIIISFEYPVGISSFGWERCHSSDSITVSTAILPNVEWIQEIIDHHHHH